MDMNSKAQWTEHTVQQLVRYEALFKLLDEIHVLDDVMEISRRVVTQWKYFANVASWRLVVSKEDSFLVIDGFRGEATVTEVPDLSAWDAHHYALQSPRLIRMADPITGPPPPEHLSGKVISEIEVLPAVRIGRCIGILSVAARHEPFSELDKKFFHIFGSHFTDRISDILLRKQAMEVLVNKATFDSLTGLLNRGAVIEHLKHQLALSIRTGKPLSVMLADIDFFKVINDVHGHLAGDKVLQEVSNRLRIQTRLSDSLGRYGGEEFLFVLYPCGREEAAKAAERFRHAIAGSPVAEADSEVSVTISIGTSTTDGHADIRMEDLLRRADEALYCSKAEGRNRVTVS